MIAAIIAALAGVFTWSLMEYCIHRWLGHDRRFIKNPFGTEHTAHHSQGDYFAPTWKKALVTLGAMAVTAPPAIALAGWVVGPAYVGGLLGFYVCYEVLHRLEHVHAGIGPYARWARSHHFYHHFHDPNKNHGVTSPLWDLVFGTYAKPGRIRVPEKLKMRWLLDPATGDVWSHLGDRYELRRQRARAAIREPALTS